MLRLMPALRGYAEPLTNAMVEFYLISQDRFTQDMQPHYVYSRKFNVLNLLIINFLFKCFKFIYTFFYLLPNSS